VEGFLFTAMPGLAPGELTMTRSVPMTAVFFRLVCERERATERQREERNRARQRDKETESDTERECVCVRACVRARVCVYVLGRVFDHTRQNGSAERSSAAGHFHLPMAAKRTF
jgi:hypothetical protein